MEERSFFYRYCIVIPTSYPKSIQFLETVLKQNNFDIQSFEDKKKKYICLSQNNEKRMLEEAESLRLKKPKNTPLGDEEILKTYLDQRIINLEKNESFKANKVNEFLPQDIYYDLYDIDKKNKDNNKRYGLGLFTENEMLAIEKSILENIPIEDVAKFSELISEEGKKDSNFIENKLLKELSLKKNKKPLVDENSLFETLINYHIIVDHFPLHISNFAQSINMKMLSLNTPYNLARSYLNDDVALYFAWTYHYTKFVSIPAITSLIIFLLAKIFKKKAEMLYMFYALGVTVWVQFFIIYWNRTESALKVEWNNDSKEYEKEDKRKEFVGEIKRSIITGKYELHYSHKKKFINYLVSCSVTFVFICIALLINVISLNLRALIPENRHKFLSMPRYKKYSNKKRIFESGSTASQLITPVKNIILTVLGIVFDKVNRLLTDYENHKSNAHYNNSYILKKFIFESINYFFDILYIAFALNDLNETTNTIKSFLYLNEVMRIVAETVLPLLKNMIYMGAIKDKENEKRLIQGEKIDNNEILKQSKFSKFNSFDEFYPLIQEFCFLTLFACCAPLTPILLLLTNSLEIRSDITKICLVTRRPEAVKKKNIGAWKYIIEFIGIMSIFTNIMFCYLYNHTIGETKYSMLTFTLFEHLLIFFIVILRFFFPLTAYWVRIYKLRKAHRENSDKGLKIKKA